MIYSEICITLRASDRRTNRHILFLTKSYRDDGIRDYIFRNEGINRNTVYGSDELFKIVT